jgi:SNF2 family DNA or RNA helicase
MVRMLDLLADYLRARGFLFQRLDGSCGRDDRQRVTTNQSF